MPGRFPDLNGGQAADPFSTNPITNTSEQIATLLADKQKALALVALLGNRILAQQEELEERLDPNSHYYASGSTSGNNLEAKAKEWEAEDREMWSQLGTHVSCILSSPITSLKCIFRFQITPNDSYPAASTFQDTSQSFDTSYNEDDFGPTRDSGPSAAQSSRRAKNAGINRPNTVGELDWYEDVSTLYCSSYSCAVI